MQLQEKFGCTSGVLQYSRKRITTIFQSLALSLRRIPLEDPKYGQSERQIMFFKAKEMLEKARQSKHGSHPTILSRWQEQEGHRRSLAEHNIGEEKSCFTIASLERHDFSATRSERQQNAKHWVLRLNAEGSQKPLRQRQEFALALKQCLKMQDADLAETRQSVRPIRPEHQQRQREDQHFEGGENSDYYVDRKTGWRYCKEPRGNPPAASLSSAPQWQNSQWQTSWSLWYSTSDKWW